MPTIHRTFAPLGAAFFLAGAASSASAADLTVNVTGLRSQQGAVVLALFDSAETFPKPGRQLHGHVVPAANTEPSVVFRGLPAGRYALVAFHDQNGNGKLDANVLGAPTEPYGFSNGAMGAAAAPSFEAAAVNVDGDAAIVVTLR